MKIYIAGPMRGHDQWNFPAFDRAVTIIEGSGHEAISPADLDRENGFDETVVKEFSDLEYHLAMRRDYRAILRSDAIAFLPGWEDSRGALLERGFGIRLGLPFFRVLLSVGMLVPERVIGLTGYARSGKDAAASFLVERGWERRAFADPIKAMLLAVNPKIAGSDLAWIVEKSGWDGAKAYPEVRTMLQRIGTEGGRQNISEDLWTRTLFERPHGPHLVIPDVRFDNELDIIRDRGGIVIHIHRPGVGPVNNHISEVPVSGADHVIVNSGSLEDLGKQVVEIASAYRAEGITE